MAASQKTRRPGGSALGVETEGINSVTTNIITPPRAEDNSVGVADDQAADQPAGQMSSGPAVMPMPVAASWGSPNGNGSACTPPTTVDCQVAAPLIVLTEGTRHCIAPETLVDLPAAHYRERWASVRELVFVLTHLLDWSHELRWSTLRFIVSLGLNHVVRGREQDANSTGILGVVLGLVVGPDDADRCERGRRAALETVALVHPDSIEAGCSRVQQRLQELGVRGHRIGDLIKHAKDLRVCVRPADETAGTSVAEVFLDLAVHDGLVVPNGWYVGANGIRRAGTNQTAWVSTSPIVILRRMIHAADGTESLEIAWNKDDRWQRRVVPRVDVATARAITELASFGVPVNSNNAADLVQYLADFEAENIAVLPQQTMSRVLGWQGPDGRDGFLWGDELIASESTNGNPPAVIFHGDDEGAVQLAGGFHAHGTFEAWRQAVGILQQFPRVRLTAYAALAPPLLRILKVPNFVLNLSSTTSQGKTIATRVAASVWGNPDERTPLTVLGKWDASQTHIERAAALRCDLPLILDDTMLANSNSEIVAQIIYQLAGGRGKARGTVKGTQPTGTFWTVLISNGESPLVSATQAGGTRPRVIELWGSPFGRTDSVTASIVTALNDSVLEHYGHAGPHFVRYLLQHRNEWSQWKAAHRDVERRLISFAGNNPLASRLMSHFATLSMVELLATTAGSVPWSNSNVINELWADLSREMADADRATAALRFVCGWAVANRDAFFPGRSMSQSPHGGWAGRWDRDNSWTEICFMQHKLEQVLAEQGYEPEAIIRQWQDREWLRTSPGRGRYYRTRLGRECPDCIVLWRTAVAPFIEDDQPEPACPSSAPRGTVGGGPAAPA